MAKTFSIFLVIVLCVALGLVNAQETNVIEIIEEEPAGEQQQAEGRILGGGRIFDALAYKENLLHNKISFLFSLIPRPAHFYPPPGFAAGYPVPIRPGAIAAPPGVIPPPFVAPGVPYPAYPGGYPLGAAVVPGINAPYGPYPPGFAPPGTLAVVAENNTASSSTGAAPSSQGSKPPAPVTAAAAAPTTPAPAAEEPAEEEEVRRHKTIKMMPKSFKMN